MTNLATEIPFKVPPVIKVIEYPGTPEQAFTRFTAEIGRWWPLATHSLAGKTEGVSVAFEHLEQGGRLVERWTTGEAHVWGTITAIDPHVRIAFTWHVGRHEDQAQHIELTFHATAPGRTRVQLVHSGWELLGERANVRRHEYDEGWNFVLSLYAPHEPSRLCNPPDLPTR
jgi:uncharacterized protein YndB with AHSA1/START domain